jgi:trans-aconitate 2-methyltransferase
MAAWDPEQYNRFADERARPFFDLIARIPAAGAVRRVADLGCGPGTLTQALRERWPEATVTGVDNSPEMLRASATLPAAHGLAFVAGDIAAWRPAAALDVAVSNAALHWVPDHGRLLPHLVGLLAPGGALAVQMPYNHREPCHALYDSLRAEPRWEARLGPAKPQYATEAPRWYAAALGGLGCAVDLWETTYHHRLAGPAAVVEWVKGSLLRPTLDRLDDDARKAFLGEYLERISAAYPVSGGATWLGYRRLFFVATLAPVRQ